MNSKQRRTLGKIFQKLCAKDIGWDDVSALIESGLGGRVVGKSGSVRTVTLPGHPRPLTLHEPHNKNPLKGYAVSDLRDFLMEAGIENE